MKKNLKMILLLIISIFTIPIIAKADMGAPQSYKYEVIVTNPDGAELYDWEGNKTGQKIPYDKKITVGFEHTIDGELYVEAYINSEDEDYIDGMVKFSDTRLFSTEIDFSKLTKVIDGKEYYAIKDTDLYKGPSTVYGKIENVKIPAGTTINYEYEVDENFSQWIYTEYEGTKGWVYTFKTEMEFMNIYDIKSTVAIKSPGKLLIIGEHDVYDNNGNTIGKVKDLEEYEYIYWNYLYVQSREYYIKSDKIEGWISDHNLNRQDPISEYNPTKYLVTEKNGIEIFEDYRLTKKVTNLAMTYGTEYTANYCFALELEEEYDENKLISVCQVEYNNEKYWINEETNQISHSFDFTIKTKEEFQMYKYSDNTESLNINIPADVTIETKWRNSSENDENGYWYYVEYENQKGWIYINKETNNTVVEEKEVNPIEDPTTEEKPSTTPEVKKDNSLTPKQTAYIAIGTAALLTVGAIFTILLINKRKKNKDEANL